MNDIPRTLHLNTAFGPSAAEAKLLACQPDEWEDDDGHQRSFVLELRGDRAVVIEVLPKPVYKSWSSTSGASYCTSNEGELWVHCQGKWARERVVPQKVQLEKIWGVSGAAPEQDALFVTSGEALHLRRDGAWELHPLPADIEIVNGLHGQKPTEIYLTTDYGLWKWDGQSISAVEGPEEELKSARVLSDDEMIVSGDEIHRWTRAEGWSTVDGDHRLTIAMTVAGGDVLLGTREGVIRVRGETVTQETEAHCNFLVTLGEDLLASGRGGLLVFHDGAWAPLTLPAFARDQTP